MRIVPFPGGDAQLPDEAWRAELDAALSGESQGPVAESWRELREDVRGLAAPMSPEFEQRMREQIESRTARSRQRHTIARPRRPRRPALTRAVAVVGAVVIACAFAGGAVLQWGVPGQRSEAVPELAAQRPAPATSEKASSSGAPANGAASSAAVGVPEVPGDATSAPGRVQLLAASLSLSTTPPNVQATADGVARLAARTGGFVESSRVQVQQRGASEAVLTLSVPSAQLAATLASIGRLAPVRAESQSSRDITDAYDAARQRLADANAERRSLLRALSQASTAGQIDSLRERLSQARATIARDQTALRAVSRRASTAEVEVTVLGVTQSEGGGLTVHRGLHDAGRVLTVALAVLLIAAAVLVPLGLLLGVLLVAGRMWRRYRRERALDAS
jgi:Domain of unknown function (DUF4349)